MEAEPLYLTHTHIPTDTDTHTHTHTHLFDIDTKQRHECAHTNTHLAQTWMHAVYTVTHRHNHTNQSTHTHLGTHTHTHLGTHTNTNSITMTFYHCYCIVFEDYYLQTSYEQNKARAGCDLIKEIINGFIPSNKNCL